MSCAADRPKYECSLSCSLFYEKLIPDLLNCLAFGCDKALLQCFRKRPRSSLKVKEGKESERRCLNAGLRVLDEEQRIPGQIKCLQLGKRLETIDLLEEVEAEVEQEQEPAIESTEVETEPEAQAEEQN